MFSYYKNILYINSNMVERILQSSWYIKTKIMPYSINYSNYIMQIFPVLGKRQNKIFKSEVKFFRLFTSIIFK